MIAAAAVFAFAATAITAPSVVARARRNHQRRVDSRPVASVRPVYTVAVPVECDNVIAFNRLGREANR